MGKMGTYLRNLSSNREGEIEEKNPRGRGKWGVVTRGGGGGGGGVNGLRAGGEEGQMGMRLV